MAHKYGGRMPSKAKAKSGYGGNSSKSGSMEGGYSGGDMKGTTSEQSYYRPMDNYKKGHEY